ncbi:MAG: spondin domain-containing protein [Acidobacteriota bacterium]
MRTRTLLSVLALSLLALPAFAVEVEVVIENVTPQAGVWLTPVWVGFHDGNFDLYNRGESLDGFPGMEALVEDGANGGVNDDFAVRFPTGVQGTLFGPSAPPIMGGQTTVARFDIAPGANTYFSYASMVIPSNDAFVANGNPLTFPVFNPAGQFTPVEFYITGGRVLDGGTEVNDEAENSTAALGQSSPNTGVDENGVVTEHPGFNRGGRVLQDRPDGDFILPGYVIAKVTVRLAPSTDVSFGADGAQQVPANASAAIAACSAALNSDRSEVSFTCEHNLTNPVVVAHVHSGAPGVNGPVIFPFADPTANPITETFAITADQVASFLDSGYYVNIHTDVFPDGEIRGQVSGCFAGPESLCLNGDRFQVSATFEDFEGNVGAAQSAGNTGDSGFFTFFGPDNIELDVKVLDACEAQTPRFWVFTAGTTNVGVEMTVTDTETGTTNTYSNALGQNFQPILDTDAFATCP